MLRTFNCGIGMVVIADASVVDVLLATVEGIDVVGTVEDMGREGGSSAYTLRTISCVSSKHPLFFTVQTYTGRPTDMRHGGKVP